MSIIHSKKSFLILSDFLSPLQAIHSMKYDHPILTKVHEVHSDLLHDEEIVFDWVPGHVGIRGNSAADTAADDALDGDISDELIPFSDLKPRMSKYIMQLWQHEWDQWLDNKLRQIRPRLSDYHPPCRSKAEKRLLQPVYTLAIYI